MVVKRLRRKSAENSEVSSSGQLPGLNRLRPLAQHMFDHGMLIGSLIAGHLLASPMAVAGPEGGVVVSGKGSISKSSSSQTSIQQDSQNLLMNFESFDLTAEESVLISQPDAAAWFVGQIIGGSPSAIFGSITANGQIALINSRGIVFGESAKIDAAGIFASALDASTEDVFGSDAGFEAATGEGGYVINHGLISASLGGSVTLLGETVTNSGVIVATLGQVNLASGSKAVVNFGPEQLLGVEITEEVLENNEGLRAAVTNTGEISADGGVVMLTSSVSKSLFDHAVNNDGVVRAKNAEFKNGVIKLFGRGASVINTGVVDVSSDQGVVEAAGSVEMFSDVAIELGDNSLIDGNSTTGNGGFVNLQAPEVLLNGAAEIEVSGASGGGDVIVESSNNVFISLDSTIDANALESGDGGSISISSGVVTVEGTLSARGGDISGSGGDVILRASEAVIFDGVVDTSASNGELGTLKIVSPDILVADRPAGDDIENLSKGILFPTALQSSNTRFEFEANNSVVIADLAAQKLVLQGDLEVSVVGTSVDTSSGNAIGFFALGEDDRIIVNGTVTVSVTDGSVNANALIDVASSIESKPFPKPLPNDPLSPGSNISLAANNGRVRIRASSSLVALSSEVNVGSISISANGLNEHNDAGVVFVSGDINVSSENATGGMISVLGDRVALLENATLSASGYSSGGEEYWWVVTIKGRVQLKLLSLRTLEVLFGFRQTQLIVVMVGKSLSGRMKQQSFTAIFLHRVVMSEGMEVSLRFRVKA